MVTGGAGFIGSHFIDFELKNYLDVEIVNVDKLTYAANEEIIASQRQEYGERYQFVKADICDDLSTLLAESRPEAVVNFAAETHVDNSIKRDAPFVRTNIDGTMNLATQAMKAGVSKFIQISTDEVYGSAAPNQAFLEKDPLNPSSPYSASKAAADLLVRSLFITYGYDVRITRSANNYGSRQHPEKLIPKIIKNAIGGQSIPVYGDGSNKRNWLAVMDNCKAIDAVLRSGQSGEIYNIAGTESPTNIQLVNKVLTLVKQKIDTNSKVEFVADRPGHDYQYRISNQKVVSRLNVTPTTKLSDGLSRTVDWYLNHADWLSSRRSF
ncbi:dTDP-glucose 4,6-dehydratase [Lentilactobacillus sp. Marseille-Q4993]|uniref:dTDP-glucose 4,6-dehydratase n=1 Tax=Lentilactobacillus sp. Marseille-Q4993 TaxID=3039492 RepID=UPI0024BD3169|nr:dTDP-glucose 4,6-dehydratase [Lentilactobacillus sp. Marseille-Q4993]